MALGERLAGLGLELVVLRLQGGPLALEALLGGEHLCDAAPDLLELLQHLLIRQVQGLGGVLRFVQGSVGLLLVDKLESLGDAHRAPFSVEACPHSMLAMLTILWSSSTPGPPTWTC